MSGARIVVVVALAGLLLASCGGEERYGFAELDEHCDELAEIAVELRGEQVVEVRPPVADGPIVVESQIDGRDATNEQNLCDYVFEVPEDAQTDDVVRFMVQRPVDDGELTEELRTTLYGEAPEAEPIEDLGDEAYFNSFPRGVPASVRVLEDNTVVMVQVQLPFNVEPGPFAEREPLEEAARSLLERLDL